MAEGIGGCIEGNANVRMDMNTVTIKPEVNVASRPIFATSPDVFERLGQPSSPVVRWIYKNLDAVSRIVRLEVIS